MKIEIETRQAEITPTANDSDTDTDTATSDTATESTAMKLEGYALVFDTPAQIDSYTEIITKGALEGCDLSDVSFFVNHGQTDIPLARTPDTLKLEVDDTGLKFTAELPDTEPARTVYAAVKRGDLRGCSFAFKVKDGGEQWEENQRTITQIEKIFEVSVVNYPAYDETSIEARKRGSNTMENQVNQNQAQNQTQTQNQSTLGSNAQKLFGVGTAEGDKRVEFGDNVLASAEYRSAFFKTLQGKELSTGEETAMKTARAEFRNSDFNTSTNTAAMIPTATLDEIISTARKEGGLLAECRAFNMPSKIAIPIATPTDKAAWHVEGAAVDSEKVTPSTVTFDGNEILKIFSISTKVQQMTISAFESYLVKELESCVMETIADSLINGTGNGQGTGILTAFNSDNTVTAASTPISYSDVVKTVAKLKRGYSAGAKWAMNNATLWNTFYGMVDSNKRPIFIADTQNESIGKILGYPIVIDDNLADNTIIFGNFNYMAYNLPSGIVVESSRESSFKSALIDYRALAIADTKPIIADAFVKLTA